MMRNVTQFFSTLKSSGSKITGEVCLAALLGTHLDGDKIRLEIPEAGLAEMLRLTGTKIDIKHHYSTNFYLFSPVSKTMLKADHGGPLVKQLTCTFDGENFQGRSKAKVQLMSWSRKPSNLPTMLDELELLTFEFGYDSSQAFIDTWLPDVAKILQKTIDDEKEEGKLKQIQYFMEHQADKVLSLSDMFTIRLLAKSREGGTTVIVRGIKKLDSRIHSECIVELKSDEGTWFVKVALSVPTIEKTIKRRDKKLKHQSQGPAYQSVSALTEELPVLPFDRSGVLQDTMHKNCSDIFYLKNYEISEFLSAAGDDPTENIVLLFPTQVDQRWGMQALCYRREYLVKYLCDPAHMYFPCTGNPGQVIIDKTILFVKIPCGDVTLYVPQRDVVQAIRDVQIQMFQFKETGIVVPYTASWTAIVKGDYVSADHCQQGSDKAIHRLQSVGLP